MRSNVGAIIKCAMIVVAACVVAGLLVYSIVDIRNHNIHEHKTQRAADFGVSVAQFDQLCPFGHDVEQCIDIHRADVDGDDRQDFVSLVFDNSLSVGMCQTVVLFATGERVTAKFGFIEENRLAGAIEARFSLVGLADIDGRPGQEIFARIMVDDRWSFSAVQYRGNKTLGKVVFRGGSLPDGPDSANIAFKSASGQKGTIVANGLACQKLDPALAYAFTVWIVTRFSDNSFTAIAVVYRPDSQSYELREDLESTRQVTVDAKGADRILNAIDVMASQTCPGFK